MKLSEAIRLGAMLRPQAFGEIERDGASCALGAAYESAGLKTIRVDGPAPGLQTRPMNGLTNYTVCVPSDWYTILSLYRPCPGDCACKLASGRTISEQIPHLNDKHRWTRERIADWVETIEREREHEAAKTQEPGVTEQIEVSA